MKRAGRVPRKIRVEIAGAGRGQSFMPEPAEVADAVVRELVAVCDVWEDRLREVALRRGVAAYMDYDRFLEHPDRDAVVLANHFHGHAPFAVKALEAGFRVMSGTACTTPLLCLRARAAGRRRLPSCASCHICTEREPSFAAPGGRCGSPEQNRRCP